MLYFEQEGRNKRTCYYVLHNLLKEQERSLLFRMSLCPRKLFSYLCVCVCVCVCVCCAHV